VPAEVCAWACVRARASCACVRARACVRVCAYTHTHDAHPCACVCVSVCLCGCTRVCVRVFCVRARVCVCKWETACEPSGVGSRQAWAWGFACDVYYCYRPARQAEAKLQTRHEHIIIRCRPDALCKLQQSAANGPTALSQHNNVETDAGRAAGKERRREVNEPPTRPHRREGSGCACMRRGVRAHGQQSCRTFGLSWCQRYGGHPLQKGVRG